MQSPIIRRVQSYILQNIEDELSLNVISEAVGISKFTVIRCFREHYKITPMRWIWQLRIQMAAIKLISNPTESITDIAFQCGFKSSTHFTRMFKDVYRVLPKVYRKRPWTSQMIVLPEKSLYTTAT